MFGKFGMLSVRFDTLVREVNEPGVNPCFRSQGFLRFAADLLRYFEKNPELTGVKLLAGVTPEINKESNVDIRLRHHIQLVPQGVTVVPVTLQEDTDAYVLEALPYHAMGQGIFELKRENAWVQRYLAFTGADAEEAAYLNIVNEIAAAVDQAISLVYVHHDLG